MKTTLSIRVLKIVLGIWWWLSIAACVIVPIILLLIWMKPSEGMTWGFEGFARGIDTSTWTAQTRDGLAGTVELKGPIKVQVQMPLTQYQLKGPAILMVLLVFMGAMSLTLYFLRLFRQIVRTMEAGDPFVAENARRIRTIGLLVMIGGFMGMLVEGLVSVWMDSVFVTKGFDLFARFGLDFWSLMAGLSIIALSEVFRQGTRIREEQALTV